MSKHARQSAWKFERSKILQMMAENYKDAIEKLPKQYSAIIVDCPPGLGFLTTNALAASDKVLIPLQCEFYALEGLSQILRVIKQVNQKLNSNLDLDA